MNWPTTPSGSSYYYELPAGNYYLASDVTTSFTKITGEVNLCLNGHTLNTGAGSAGIQVAGEDAVLNLCDCGTRGTVTGASKSAMADIAEVEVENKASFSLYGGTVHNTADGGVAQGVSTLSGTLNLYGGTVISDCDNAVWFDRWQAVALHISGGPVLRGAADKADVILYTFGSSSKTVTLDGPLTAAQPYRVAVQGAKPFTTGWSGHMDGADFSDYFVSATKGLFFEENGGELMFSEYAITGQPTAENGYTVTANGAPACAPAGYQWYPAKVTTEAVTDRNATGYSGSSGAPMTAKRACGSAREATLWSLAISPSTSPRARWSRCPSPRRWAAICGCSYIRSLITMTIWSRQTKSTGTGSMSSPPRQRAIIFS